MPCANDASVYAPYFRVTKQQHAQRTCFIVLFCGGDCRCKLQELLWLLSVRVVQRASWPFKYGGRVACSSPSREVMAIDSKGIVMEVTDPPSSCQDGSQHFCKIIYCTTVFVLLPHGKEFNYSIGHTANMFLVAQALGEILRAFTTVVAWIIVHLTTGKQVKGCAQAIVHLQAEVLNLAKRLKKDTNG